MTLCSVILKVRPWLTHETQSAGTKVAGELNQLVDEMVEELEHKLSAVSAEIMAKSK